MLKKILFAILLCGHICCARAETLSEPMPEAQPSAIQIPVCEDAAFKQKVMSTVESYFDEKPISSTMDHRQRMLKLKGLHGFETLKVSAFEPQQNYLVAKALVELKINKHLTDKDIVLCRQTGDVKAPVYLVAYPEDNHFRVHLINLDDNVTDYEKIFFLYP